MTFDSLRPLGEQSVCAPAGDTPAPSEGAPSGGMPGGSRSGWTMPTPRNYPQNQGWRGGKGQHGDESSDDENAWRDWGSPPKGPPEGPNHGYCGFPRQYMYLCMHCSRQWDTILTSAKPNTCEVCGLEICPRDARQWCLPCQDPRFGIPQRRSREVGVRFRAHAQDAGADGTSSSSGTP